MKGERVISTVIIGGGSHARQNIDALEAASLTMSQEKREATIALFKSFNEQARAILESLA